MRLRWLALTAALLVALGACSANPDELLARAQRSMEQGDYRAASIDLKTLLQRQPNSAEGRYALGVTSLETGDPQSALRELEMAARLGIESRRLAMPLARSLLALRRYDDALKVLDPSKAQDEAERHRLHILRGDAHLGGGRPAQAVVEFERALQLRPQDVTARLGLASARLETEGFAAARREVDIAIAAAPEDPQTHLLLATLLLRDRQFEAAAQAFEQSASLAQKSDSGLRLMTALAGLCESQLALGRGEEANATILRLQQLAPESPVTLYLRARAAFLRGEYDLARVDLERILARDAHNRPAQLLLGAVNYANGNLGQADMHLSAVLAAEPDNNFARRLLAESRLRQRKPREALSVLEPGDGDKPDSAIALALAGTARVQAGDLDAGLQYLERGAAAGSSDAGTVIQLAAGYIAAGRTDTAIRILDSLKADGSMGYRRDLVLIGAQLRAGDRAGAVERALDLARRNSSAPEVQALVGGLLVSAGDMRAARTHFDIALELNPSSPAAHLNLGKLDLLEGKPDAAERRFQEALRLRPGEPAALVALAQVALAKGNRDGAVRWLETARKENPQAVEPRVLLAQYYLGRRDLARAESLASEAIRIAPDNAAALNVLGVTLASAGRMRDGVDTLNRAAAASPGSAQTLFNLASAYLAAGEPEPALRTARKALELRPDDIRALAMVAALESARGQDSEARRMLEQIRKIDPKYPGLAVIEAELAMRAGNAAAAVKSYDAALANAPSANIAVRAYVARRTARAANPLAPLELWLLAHPDDMRVRLVFADALAQMGNQDAAVAQLEQVVAAEPENVAALNNLSWTYHLRNDARALDTAARAYALASKSPMVADTYGWILLAADKVTEALAILQEAARLAPQEPNIAFHHAAALARSGAREEATRRLRTLLADHSDFSERGAAQALLTQLSG
ncbi:MAG TPA: XrtA/PEP-CTERM system TPR-repeat protein PrsT [Steroidobacteraceae bacterium]|nr:XrtA/PEP-CTERM system TPR-repeat protein PrsT [Steroidobacteraceae bacterium]